MGVEYFDCLRCGRTLCHWNDYAICMCGRCFCTCCEDELKIHFENIDGEYDECFYCTKNVKLREITDKEFVKWLKEISGKTQKDYIQHLLEKGDLENCSDTE